MLRLGTNLFLHIKFSCSHLIRTISVTKHTIPLSDLDVSKYQTDKKSDDKTKCFDEKKTKDIRKEQNNDNIKDYGKSSNVSKALKKMNEIYD